MSTAAITTVIDRLEKSGFVQRSPDPSDRRKILITANHEKIEKEIVPHLQSFFQAMGKLFLSTNPKKQKFIVDFMVQVTKLFEVETKKLRNQK